MPNFLNRFRQDEGGASMVEYVLLVALIAVVVATGALALGDNKLPQDKKPIALQTQRRNYFKQLKDKQEQQLQTKIEISPKK
jgi:Flp pilus assembly pilin Flp